LKVGSIVKGDFKGVLYRLSNLPDPDVKRSRNSGRVRACHHLAPEAIQGRVLAPSALAKENKLKSLIHKGYKI